MSGRKCLDDIYVLLYSVNGLLFYIVRSEKEMAVYAQWWLMQHRTEHFSRLKVSTWQFTHRVNWLTILKTKQNKNKKPGDVKNAYIRRGIKRWVDSHAVGHSTLRDSLSGTKSWAPPLTPVAFLASLQESSLQVGSPITQSHPADPANY